jgi:DNA-binding transcriptional ArsR family regulator
MGQVLDITRALADESRLRALLLLGSGELCLCQIIEVLGLAPSTVSRHMAILHAAGLVQRRKEGKWHYYRQAGRGAPGVVRQALRWVGEHMADEPTAAADAGRLQRALKKDLEVLCACYRS